MRFYYARINENNICDMVIDTFAEKQGEEWVSIPQYDESLINKLYINGDWVEVSSETTE